MQEYFELEQAFSISMPQLGFQISIAYKKACMWSPPLYLLTINTVDGRELRCLIITQHSFCQPSRLFQRARLLTLEIYANLPVYCTLPVYDFGQNIPVSPFILPSPPIWNSRVSLLILKFVEYKYHFQNTIFFLMKVKTGWKLFWNVYSGVRLQAPSYLLKMSVKVYRIKYWESFPEIN